MFEIRYNYGPNIKYVNFDSEDQANRFYEKVIRFAKNRKNKLSGTVALWNGKWRIKFNNF